jgi:hypothetical protein
MLNDTNGANGKTRTKQNSGQGLSPGSKAHYFKKGHGGRKIGSTNTVTRVLKEAVILAAESSGDLSDHGKGKLTGYLKWASREHPKAFLGLLGRLLPIQQVVDSYTQTIYKSYEQVDIEMRHQGLSLDAIERLKKIDLTPPDVDDVKEEK